MYVRFCFVGAFSESLELNADDLRKASCLRVADGAKTLDPAWLLSTRKTS